MNDDNAEVEVLRIVDSIKPLLAGHGPEIQGAVCAELLSLWLAGHHQAGGAAIAQLLANHIEHVRLLVPVNIEIIKKMYHR